GAGGGERGGRRAGGARSGRGRPRRGGPRAPLRARRGLRRRDPGRSAGHRGRGRIAARLAGWAAVGGDRGRRVGGRAGRAAGMTAAGYSATPLPRKLGIKAAAAAAFLNAPEDFAETMGALPDG